MPGFPGFFHEMEVQLNDEGKKKTGFSCDGMSYGDGGGTPDRAGGVCGRLRCD